MNMFQLLSEVERNCKIIMADNTQKGFHFMFALQLAANACHELKRFF